VTARNIRWVVAVAALAASSAGAQDESRGALLYSTHCEQCHTAQVHWRDRKVAKDWPGLVVEVRRWQANAALGWGDDDVLAVARYLNRTFYRFPGDSPAPLALRR
jgi:mono/diheme cytochrome c family protein